MAIVKAKELQLLKKYNKIEKGRALMYKTLSNFSEHLKESNNSKHSNIKDKMINKKLINENSSKELELKINMDMKRHETNRSLILQSENKLLKNEKYNLHISSVREKYHTIQKSEVISFPRTTSDRYLQATTSYHISDCRYQKQQSTILMPKEGNSIIRRLSILSADEKFKVQNQIYNLRKKKTDKDRIRLLTHIAPEIDWKKEITKSIPFTPKPHKKLYSTHFK